MPTTPSKRSASTSPDDNRPSKHQVTSSPEEGEVDDVSPPPPPPPATPPKTRVPFPFKRKAPAREDAPPPLAKGELLSRIGPVVYERSQADELRFREDDERRWQSRSRRSPQSRIDRWEPLDRYEGSSRSRYADSYTSLHHYDHYRPETERNYPPRPPSSRRHNLSRSPSTPRSRSPLSPPLSKEKHRLPPRREIDPLPPPNDDFFCSHSSRSRSRERRRYSPDGRGNGKEDRHRSSWGDDRYSNTDDRYYRSHYESWNGRDDRRRDRSRQRHDSHYDRDSDSRGDTYRPISPGAQSPRPRSPQPLQEPSHGPLTPPPPASSPPPRPPSVHEDDSLPTTHSAIKFALPSKRAATPVNVHSPTPLEPAKTDVILERRDDHIGKSGQQRGYDQKPESGEIKLASLPPRPKRKPVARTREEEQRVYGRIFVGCGKQDDYNVLTKLGEGTFGEVHKAIHRTNGTLVALKRILMHNEKEGMPVTALREIKILKALRHPCIVDILDMFVVKSQGKDSQLSVYMVFPYMDHDLAGLLENERVKLSPSQIKLYMKQLLEGTDYMHRNHILHRDMKAANLLISNKGTLMIADFGLARAFDPNIVKCKEDARGKERKYTNCVVTRWYRPPELLLGARQYGGEVDMWGIGCVMAEMFWRRPILAGSSDLDQLDKIWQLCGTPTTQTWPGYDALPGCEGVKRFALYPRRVKQVYEMIGPETVDLLDKLLTCNPRERITAEKALDHDYFWTDPLPADPKTLPNYEASHEYDKRGRRNQHPGGPPIPQGIDGQARPLPLPVAQGPPLHMQHRRPPPPREFFRNGPPISHFACPPNGIGPGGPGLGYPPFPPPPYGQQRFPHGMPGPGPVPMPPPPTLAPISLRPGQPPPQIMPWQQPPPSMGVGGRMVHLPPRPVPMGRGMNGGAPVDYPPPPHGQLRNEPSGGYGGSDQLNYG